jgi:hypothetical protein
LIKFERKIYLKFQTSKSKWTINKVFFLFHVQFRIVTKWRFATTITFHNKPF